MDKTAYAKLFSTSLQCVTGQSGAYCCPLCLQATPVDQATSLTWDHYPPRSIGGRRSNATLVCRGCHERWGPTDAELVKLRNRDEFDKLYPRMVPVIVSIHGEPSLRGLRHREAIGVHDGTIRLVGRPQDNPGEATDRLTMFLDQVHSESSWDGLRMSARTDLGLMFSRRQIELSFLKAAYLASFDGLGFPYIMSPALNTVRQQLLEPEAEHLKGTLLAFSPQPKTDPHLALAYVHTPQVLSSLAVFFFGYHLSQWCIVFLPLPACPGPPEYGRLEQTLRDSGHLGFVQFDPSPEFLTDPNVVIVDQHGKERPIYRPS